MARLFGENVTKLVEEVTDDMTLSYEERKRAQIRKAYFLSDGAKAIKIADKIANIRDVLTVPLSWSIRRKRQYVEWSQSVVAGCRGVNSMLEKAFDDICNEAKIKLANE
jgi:(p)ppGpp synthase/HD superfamily hydrolase